MDLLGTTRGRILVFIKEHGRSHPDAIANHLDLATTSVRQHLASLQRDGYVTPEEVREGAGRPRREYRVTSDGDALFPKRYDALAATLLHATHDGRQDDLLGAFVETEVARHKGRVNGFDTRTRMQEVAEGMRGDGGLAYLAEENGSLTLCEPNCIYASVAGADRAICDAHVAIIERLLAVPVAFERAPDPYLGGCRWTTARNEHQEDSH